jgi:hypothetical protein
VVERGFKVDVVEAVSAQPLFVCACPRSPTVVDDPLPQKQFRQPMSHPHQIGAGIFTGTHQIAERLDFPPRHPHRGGLTQPQQPGQMRGIAGVGLDPIPSRALQLRRRGNQALHPGLVDRPRQPEAGRTRLIGHPHRGPQLMQPAQDLTVIRAQSRPSELSRSSSTACATTESACTSNPTLVP